MLQSSLDGTLKFADGLDVFVRTEHFNTIPFRDIASNSIIWVQEENGPIRSQAARLGQSSQVSRHGDVAAASRGPRSSLRRGVLASLHDEHTADNQDKQNPHKSVDHIHVRTLLCYGETDEENSSIGSIAWDQGGDRRMYGATCIG